MKLLSRVGLSLFLAMFLSLGVLGLWSVLLPEQAHAAVYTVTLITDTMPVGVPGELRWAINAANATPGVPDNITFAIPAPGPQTIIPIAPLPAITDTVTIDGYTQPGSVPPGAGPAAILVELAGMGAGPMADGLWFQLGGSNGSVVRGLAINRFSWNGVYVQSANNVIVEGNNIGTDVVGGTPLPNGQYGVYVFGGSTGCIIGGPAAPSRNVISGNGQDGVRMVASTGNTVSANYIGTDAVGIVKVPNNKGVYLSSGSNNNTIGGLAVGQRNVISGNSFEGVNIDNSTGNNVQGNYIGTDLNGTAALGNGTAGVYLVSSATGNNTIGGNTASHRNVISGNASYGVWMNSHSNSFVYGNYIGTDASGAVAMANGVDGVLVSSGSNGNTIGGGAAGQGNVISGNTSDGIYINNSTGNNLQGNYIGTDVSGISALGNGLYGVEVYNSANSNTIGGSTAGQGNLISGNKYGVVLSGVSGSNLQGNYIGTNAAGTAALGNSYYGVYLTSGASSNTVGGTTAGQRNIISSNNQVGLTIENSSNNNVQGNYIGTNAAGTAALGNTYYGIWLKSGASSNTIGGNTAGHRNVISGNGQNGVYIDGSTGNNLQGNYIGTNAAGAAALPNGISGVYVLSGANNNTVGGTTTAQGNLLSGNGYQGVYITGSSGNQVKANYVGVNAAGNGALGNAQDGIWLNGANNNTVGGTTAAERNVVSANTWNGVRISGSTGNTVSGNYVGTDAAGTTPLANTLSGVLIEGTASNNTVGGSAAGQGNLISGNGRNGVYVFASTGNFIEQNHIGTDVAGTTALPNAWSGVMLDSGANNNTIGGTTAGHRNVIGGNSSCGISVAGSTGNSIQGNFVGTNAAGTAALANTQYGIFFQNGADNNTIGGTTTGHRNVISGNTINGVRINNAAGNNVQGNYIGTNAAGNAALANGSEGVYLMVSASGNTIGGATAGHRNVISGNTSNGVRISGANGNFVQGNYIGTDAAGTAAVANLNGVIIHNSANDNTVGGATAGQGNLISGNTGAGASVQGSTGNSLKGNYVGVNAAGNAALGNGTAGISFSSGANNNTIGGTTANERNLISGNVASGISIDGSSGNNVRGNYIGINAAGTAALANGGEGIYLLTAATGNTIGGATAGYRNVISGNASCGVRVEGATGNTVQGNYIGTGAAGTAAVQNTYNGIFLLSAANGNAIGGPTSGQGNLISGNGGYGVYANGSSSCTFMGNYVGTNAAGTAAVPNMSCGIFLWNGSTATVGGGTAAERNLISGNNTDGVYIEQTSGSTISGNYVGTNALGTAVLGNGRYGIFLNNNSGSSTIGGGTAAERNLISGNSSHGIYVRASTGSTISNNYIGPDVSGANALSNGGDGIAFSDSADSNIVGGSAGDSNLIASNTSDGVSITSSVDCEISHNQIGYNTGIGVVIWDAASIRNEISENSICGNGALGIDLMGDGVTPNDGDNDNHAKANRGYNFPEFAGTVLLVESDTYVFGTAPPNARVELYFTGATPDPSGHGEGLTCLDTVTADASGNFSAVLTGLAVGDRVAAIAISPAGDPSGEGNTSEFSLNAQVAQGYAVNASVSGGHGYVEKAFQVIESGGTAAIHMHPDTGCHVASITDNGTPAAIANPYVISGVTADHTVVVTFAVDVPTTHPWYLAEGCTEGGMETWVLVQNPNATDVTVDLTFMTSTGTQNGPQDVTIAGNSRNSFNVGSYVTDWNVSTVVTPDGGNVICERAMYGPGRVWAHDSIGATETAVKWYLAEGSTEGGMETWVLVQNPGAAEVGVNISFQTDAGEVAPPALQDVKIPATSRRSFRVNDYVTTYNVSTRIDSTDGGVICERSVYGPGRVWAHESIGVIVPSTTWYLAEGSTEGGMETFVLVQNPTDNEAHVSVVFQTDAGEVAPAPLQGVTVPPNSRKTFKANDYVTTYNVSTRVTSADQLVICERAMYGNDRDWAHDSIGVITPAAVWYLAEGCTEGGMETFVLVQNPGTVDVTVDLTFMTSTGEQAGPQDFKVQAGTRHTFKVNDYVGDWNVSTKVESTMGNVICERAMYGNNRGWAHDSVGYAP